MTMDELTSVYNKCRTPNWDGYEAFPVELPTLDTVRRVLSSIPPDIPRPSIGAEPDGALTLEWYAEPRRVLSVSVTSDGKLHYAALIGQDCISGTELFGAEFPKTFVQLITRVYPAPR